MYSLTDTDEEKLEYLKTHGATFLGSKDIHTIRFNKAKQKPDRKCKSYLKELGYKITNQSGAKHYPCMDYEKTF